MTLSLPRNMPDVQFKRPAKTNSNASNVGYYFSFGSGRLKGYDLYKQSMIRKRNPHRNVGEQGQERAPPSQWWSNVVDVYTIFVKIANGMLHTSLISLEKYSSRTCVTCINSKQNRDEKSEFQNDYEGGELLPAWQSALHQQQQHLMVSTSSSTHHLQQSILGIHTRVAQQEQQLQRGMTFSHHSSVQQ